MEWLKREKTVVIESKEKRTGKKCQMLRHTGVELGQNKKPPVSRTVPLCKAGLLESYVWDFKGEGRNFMWRKIVIQKNSSHWKTLSGEADLHIYQTQS